MSEHTQATSLPAVYQERKYAARTHWLIDNYPEVHKAYIKAFYSNDIALTGCASEFAYVGCEGYPDYDRRSKSSAENDPNCCVGRGWCECGI